MIAKLHRPHFNIVQRFVGYSFLSGVIPLFVVGAVSYLYSAGIVQQEASQYTGQLVINQRDYLALQMEQVESLLSNVSGVQEIRDVLQENVTSNAYADLSTQARIGYILNGYSNLKGLVALDIFTVNGVHYHVGDTLNAEDVRQDEVDRLFAETQASDQLIYWAGVGQNVNAASTSTQVVTLAKKGYRIDPQTLQEEPVAVFLASYSTSYLYDHFHAVDLGKNAYLLILDQQGRIIYHPNPVLIGTQADPKLLKQLTGPRDSTIEVVNGTRMSVNRVVFDDRGWIVASFVPVDTLFERAAPIRNVTLLILVLGLGLVTIVTFAYNRQTVSPIREITRRFQRLSTSSPAEQTPLKVHGHDEIAQLGQGFNSLLDSLEARQRAEHEREKLIEELQTANRIAEESVRVKSEFLSTMSHELRTPLNAIIGFSDTLLMGIPGEMNDKQRHKMERLRENGVRLLNLVNDILDLTRIEANRVDLVAETLSPVEISERMVNQMKVLAERKGIEFKTSVDPTLPPLLVGDQQRIEQIVINLLSNAFKFTEQGSVTLTMEAAQNQTWTIAVADTGIGIAPHAQEIIFEEFRQIDGSSSRAYQGTGLGLAIVRKLVHLMGGQVKVESALSKGSTFTVYLPLQAAPLTVERGEDHVRLE